jgi:hypothetical protein
MKRTAYVIEGQSFDKPDGILPAGFVIRIVEVDDPRAVRVEGCNEDKSLEVTPSGDSVVLRLSVANGPMVAALFGRDSARQVRDCLNAILGDDASSPVAPTADTVPALDEDKPKRRVFRDRDDDLQWEVEPDVFVCASSLTLARRYRANGEGLSLESVTADYAPLTDVTSRHPEINEGA